MGSDGNKKTTEDGTYESTECANGCGFFGSPDTMNLCSKCFREEQKSSSSAAAAKPTIDNQTQIDGFPPSQVIGPSSSSMAASTQPPSSVDDGAAGKAASNRCLTCNKKMGVLGFKCKCGSTFCGIHRYPEKHNCEFDFKGSGRDAIAKANPVVKTDKVDRF